MSDNAKPTPGELAADIAMNVRELRSNTRLRNRLVRMTIYEAEAIAEYLRELEGLKSCALCVSCAEGEHPLECLNESPHESRLSQWCQCEGPTS